LAKAVAGVSGSSFFNVSSATLISKWRGDSEKILKCLFDAGRCCGQATLFLDEIDAVAGSRHSGEHEANRRLKTTLFTLMDGLNDNGKEGTLMVLGTTNCPWDLDEAIRRRLEKRIYVSLPDEDARKEVFYICFKGVAVDEGIDLREFARKTDGYSGADIQIVCREAAMQPARRLLSGLNIREVQTMRSNGELEITPVTSQDIEDALISTKPATNTQSVERFVAWMKEFGST